MLEHNNPAINVDRLMAKVRAEVSKRHFPDGTSEDVGQGLPADALATVASIESSINAAAEKSQIRTGWSGRLNRFPFNLSVGLQRFFLSVLAFVFKDQRHVNFAVVHALRESLTMNVRLAEQVDQLRARLNGLEDRLNNIGEVAATSGNGSRPR
ncbi:MAG: hypothetical protein NVS9B12_10850 [Vulcanimicrobiaceae bacterium]